ncbi:MAG: hypothetical protein R3C55_06315 [Parvularculaceae bacterium]
MPRLHSAIWSLTHDRPFEFKEPLQKPVIFYIPDLPAAPRYAERASSVGLFA